MAEPKVRFKRDDGSSYPTWKNMPMSDVFTEISEKNHPELPVLSVLQGVGTVLRDSSDRNIQYDKSNLKNYKAMKKDDFIIHLRSFEGGLECSNYDGISSPAYRILRPIKILSAAYKDCFRSYDFIRNKLAVSVVGIRDGKSIDMETFWEIPMDIPSIDEQKKIASFLSSVDAVITVSEEEVANLETQKKAAMNKIFSQKVRFKRVDGSDYPDWANVRFEDVFTEIVRRTSDIVTYPLFSLTIEDGVTAKTERYERSYLVKIEEDNYKIVPPKAFVYNPMNLRFGALAPSHETKDVCVSQYYNVFSIKDETTLGFWESYLVNDQMLKYYYSIATGSLVEKLRVHYSTFINIVKKVPCTEEQRHIAQFLSNFDEAIAAAKKELDLWKELKKGLLQQMFV